jgi:hypothetical protein
MPAKGNKSVGMSADAAETSLRATSNSSLSVAQALMPA